MNNTQWYTTEAQSGVHGVCTIYLRNHHANQLSCIFDKDAQTVLIHLKDIVAYSVIWIFNPFAVKCDFRQNFIVSLCYSPKRKETLRASNVSYPPLRDIQL